MCKGDAKGNSKNFSVTGAYLHREEQHKTKVGTYIRPDCEEPKMFGQKRPGTSKSSQTGEPHIATVEQVVPCTEAFPWGLNSRPSSAYHAIHPTLELLQ